jgi:hypothetical protein
MPNEYDDYIEDDDENALRAHIFQSDDREELLIPVPEWKRKILIKALTGTARCDYLAFQMALEKEHKDSGEYFKRLWFEAARLGCVHPKTKQPVFKLPDRDTLMNEKNGAALQTIGRTVQIFSKLDGSVGEQVRKNLLGIQSSTTTTQSQSDSAATTGE